MERFEFAIALYSARKRFQPEDLIERTLEVLQEEQRGLPGSRLPVSVGLSADPRSRRELRGAPIESDSIRLATCLL